MSYTLLDRTRFGVTGRRGLEFSSELDSPYYVLTVAGISDHADAWPRMWTFKSVRRETSCRIAPSSIRRPPVDVGSNRSRGRGQRGFGFKVGDTGRFGFEVVSRQASFTSPRFVYEGYRAGVKITYGT